MTRRKLVLCIVIDICYHYSALLIASQVKKMSILFYVMASGGLYSPIYITIHSPYKLSLCFEHNYQNTEHMIHITCNLLYFTLDTFHMFSGSFIPNHNQEKHSAMVAGQLVHWILVPWPVVQIPVGRLCKAVDSCYELIHHVWLSISQTKH